MTAIPNSMVEDARWFLQRARSPRLRTMRQFAEDEIVIPNGPFAGRRFSVDRQPYSGLWLDAVDSGQWRRVVSTGPVQSGKTLLCFAIPALYHLFEHGETCIIGLPDMDMAGDKLNLDLLPVIERTKYKAMLPTSGAGSRGGKVESIRFNNGAVLKFMSGGGSDKSRAGFTARVLIVSETDGLDSTSGGSREADKISQLEARTQAFGAQARTYLECTTSIASGRTWREYLAGTESKIMLPCPHCRAWVAPEREHLTGWQDADTEFDACKAEFCCPACGEVWNEAERRHANRRGALVHRGQEIVPAGEITGEPPQTFTLGFRWSSIHNLFKTAGDIGRDEWTASRDPNPENAERKMKQQVWALPYEPPSVDMTPLQIDLIASRVGNTGKGMVPLETQFLTLGIDLRKRELHYVLIAWWGNATGRIMDYGVFGVQGDQLGAELGVLTALRDFRDSIEEGWMLGGSRRVPNQVWIDAGWLTSTVYSFVSESNRERYRPLIGRGIGVYNSHKYTKPREVNQNVRFIGDEYHISFQPDSGLLLCEVNVDHWKGWLHERISCPPASDGALTLFDAPRREHISFARHLTSEKRIEEFAPGRGTQIRWVRDSGESHWLDSATYAAAAGHFCGTRIITPALAAPEKRKCSVIAPGRTINRPRW